jgi:histidinol dehydrogenase
MEQKPILKIKHFTSLQENWLRKRRTYKTVDDPSLQDKIGTIIKNVRVNGDKALLTYTEKFDKVNLENIGIKVSKSNLKEAYNHVGKDEINALIYLKERVTQIETQKLKQMQFDTTEEGLTISHTFQSIQSVGCYIPGGQAVYPSTLIMTVTPAKVANVPRIVVCSPPTFQGEISPLIRVAADICGVDEVYRLGGAQAIAALTYGTKSVKPVLKIVGPGSKYVTLAKIIVSKEVAIDLPAGPSELLILADETTNPRYVAWDLISQAEHTADNVVGLVTSSEKIALEVISHLERIIPTLSRKNIILQSLTQNGFILICKTIDEALTFINDFAPEHLEVMIDNPRTIVKKITSAGIILLGEYSPVSGSDYFFGTNHVLPTSGFSHIYSGLSIFDYLKRIDIVDCSKKKLRNMQKIAKVLANSEDLPNHYRAIKERFIDES